MAARALMLIGGQWRDTPERRDVRSPADQRLVGQVAVGGRAEARAAADAAAAALDSWSASPARQRADVLRRAADLIGERAEQLGGLLAAEAGKRRPEGVGEVRFAAEYFRWFGEQARRPLGEVHPHEAPGRRHLTIRRPAGVVASLTPWNFPCSIQARKEFEEVRYLAVGL